jgi:glycosyltransferase involved in cell wall biosynthesis
MKIAIIFSKHSESLFNRNSKRTFGGGEIQMYNIAKELNRFNSLQVFSLVQDYKKINFDEKDKFNLIKTFKDNDNVFLKGIKLHKILSKLKPNILIQRGITPYSYFLAKYCKYRKVKFILMFGHDFEADGKYQSSLKKCRTFNLLIKNSDKIIVQNNFQKNKIINLNKEVFIIKKGLNLENFNNINKKIKKYDGVWVGRSEPWKRADIFLDLVKKNPESKFLMVLAKMPYSESWLSLIKKGASNLKNLDYFENVNNKKANEFMNKGKILIFTSEREGDWPMVVLEASASQIPILSYNLNYDDLIDKYKGGIFCNSNFEFMNKKFKYLTKNENKCLEMGKNARKYIGENHDLKINTEKLLKLLIK